ncbi:MAG: hypothetical protein M3506_09875, partial [Chloroflexota bacterium]|nr:hypothetical protein [Chloroflexota bacterium]
VTYLRFDHAYAFEQGYFSYYDGGVVEYSINSGTSWVDAGSLFTSDGWGYQGAMESGYGNPLGGRQGYVGSSDGYFSSRMNLTSLAGKSVRIRFRIGADVSGPGYGWFVDDIRAYTCAASTRPVPSATNRLRNPGFEYDDDNNSLPDDWTADQGALRMPTIKRTGQYALRHKAVDNQAHVISQVATGLTAGKTYAFTGYVNIPTTTAAVSYSLDIQFRNAAGTVIQTVPIKAYAAHTSGVWNLASKSAVAPTGATNARVRMIQRGVTSTVYTDDFVLKP